MVKQRARLTVDNDPLTRTDAVLAGLEKLSKSASQQVDKLTSEQDKKLTGQQVNKSASEEVEKLTSSPVEKATLKKATFQLKQEVLEELDRFHLQLQLELGKQNTPYKEIMVEEAIAQLLQKGESGRPELVEMLQKRQSQR